jgi:hypothetical protein
MRFHLFKLTPERRAAQLLEDARMAAVEHEAAAEHHGALARMYRLREHRLAPVPQPPESKE